MPPRPVIEVMPAGTGPGYTTDPYNTPEEHAECDDAISKFTAQWTGPGGLLSTWRERHIAINGIWAGLRAPQFADIPDCPPLWVDEVQYYRGAALISNVAKIYGTSALATLAGGYVALKAAGVPLPV